jgi:hypothetical protein
MKRIASLADRRRRARRRGCAARSGADQGREAIGIDDNRFAVDEAGLHWH